MKSTTLRRSVCCPLVFSIALAGATLAIAQAPAPPEAKPGAPAAAPEAPGADPAQKRERRAPAEAKGKGKAKAKTDAETEATPSTSGEGPLTPLAWLEGCWISNVNKRETREQWLPLRGNLLLGMSQTVVQGKTQSYEYLRIESRPDGVYYVALPSGKDATSFKFEGKTVVTMGDRNDDAFVFTNPSLEFPQKLVYRRATLGWLYASVAGKVAGNDKEVVYPLRRTDCETGEVIER